MKHDMNRLLIALKKLDNIGNVKIIEILEEEKISYDNCHNFFEYKNFSKIKKLKSKINKEKLNDIDWKMAKEYADAVLKRCEQKKIDVISVYDSVYPDNLLALKNHPVIIYVRGNADILNQKAVAIIGTREPTPLGKKMSKRFGAKLGSDGYVIVSGLAIGCDSYGHMGALEVGASTIAWLAHGLDQPVYPKVNRELAEKIIDKGGALVSEYEPGIKLKPQNLVVRDAWQSGMSDGIIAVETGIKGGTLHAMNHAWDNKRPIGMLDIKSLIPNVSDARIPSGNREFIAKGTVSALASLESVNEFEKKLQKTRKKILSQNIKKFIPEDKFLKNSEINIEEKLF